MQIQLEKAEQLEQQNHQNMISREVHEDLCRKSAACKEELALTLEKVGHTQFDWELAISTGGMGTSCLAQSQPEFPP